MPLSTAGKNVAMNALKGTAPASSIAYASIHTALPSDTGSNEVTGGSPAYARKAIAFAAATTGVLDDSTNGIAFDMPAGSTAAYVGFWSAVTAGTFLGYQALTGETYAGQGVYNLTNATITAS